MKKLLLVLLLSITLVLSGCEEKEITDCDYEYKFRTQIVEITEDGYIVEKYEYRTNDLFKLHTNEVFELEDIVYVVTYEDGTAKLYSEINCD